MTPPPPPHPELRPDILIQAYAQGVFPMAMSEEGPDVIGWFSPDPRGVIPLDAFHVPRSLAKVIRQARFEIRSDTAFGDVMRGCAAPRPIYPGSEELGTWIDANILHAYERLHELGFAHSVEAWHDDVLVGGLYGVALGGAFFGESMFFRPDADASNASKICLVALVGHMRLRAYELLDTQYNNHHLERFGCTDIPRDTYLEMLHDAIQKDVTWNAFDADAALRRGQEGM